MFCKTEEVTFKVIDACEVYWSIKVTSLNPPVLEYETSAAIFEFLQTNLTLDTEEFNTGSGSFNFDVDVSQSGNNKATIYNDNLNDEDLSDDVNLASWLIDVKIPDITYTSSWTIRWGSDSSNY